MENALTTQPLGRARTATLVAVGPRDRLTDVTSTLAAGDGAGALHIVRIVTDGTGAPDGDERADVVTIACLLYTSPSPRDRQKSRMPSSA